jgi:hypothetical protein
MSDKRFYALLIFSLIMAAMILGTITEVVGK